MTIPNENLLIKLWDTLIDKGVGSLLRPWQTKREGKAAIEIKTEEILAIAQAEKYAADIKVGKRIFQNGLLIDSAQSNNKDDETVFIDSSEVELLESQAEQLLIINELNRSETLRLLKEEINIAKAIVKAEAILETDDAEIIEESIDDDWLFKWRDCAGSVSNEELQSIWGSLLAGELKSPGKFSLRTVDFLRNLSQREAESISKLSRFIVGNVIFRGNQKILDDEGVDFGFLLEMQQLGVLSGIESLGLNTSWPSSHLDSYMLALISNNRVLLVRHEDPKKILTLSVYKVSSVAMQIISLGNFEAHNDYLRSVAENIKSQGFEVELARCDSVAEGIINYSNAIKI
jgi:Protein of unknown function (DUF2806)